MFRKLFNRYPYAYILHGWSYGQLIGWQGAHNLEFFLEFVCGSGVKQFLQICFINKFVLNFQLKILKSAVK